MHEFYIHSTPYSLYLMPFLNYLCSRVTRSFTFSDIKKVRRRKTSTCVHFRVQFLYSCLNDVRCHIWTWFGLYFTHIYDCTLTLVVWVNSNILRNYSNSFLYVHRDVLYLVMNKSWRNDCFLPNSSFANENCFRDS